MCWDLLLTCRVVELPIDIFVLWLWVAHVGCSGNLAYALCLDGSFPVVLTFLSGVDYSAPLKLILKLAEGYTGISLHVARRKHQNGRNIRNGSIHAGNNCHG